MSALELILLGVIAWLWILCWLETFTMMEIKDPKMVCVLLIIAPYIVTKCFVSAFLGKTAEIKK